MSERLVVATGQGGLEDQVSSVFGRAPTFTVVELQNGKVADASVAPNPHKDAPSGAGIQAAQMVASKAPRAVLAGNFGPNVSGVLSQAGVDMLPVSGMTVGEAVDAYLTGSLSASAGPSESFGSEPRSGPGSAQGMGRGAGRGMGRGAGRGRGLGMGAGMWGSAGGPAAPVQPEDPQVLKTKVGQLESELEDVKRRLSQLEGGV
ncbi:MAG: NifB/NifX family molybdenum-iron cluster-binding protein [Candidatus Bipolaricaulota bacterium]